MNMEVSKYLEELIRRYPVLEPVKGDILGTYEILENCYRQGGKVLIAGNGGSCADAEHMVGELMKGFVKRRELALVLQERLRQVDDVKGGELAEQLQGVLPAIALTGHASLSTAFSNDVNGEMVFAQQVCGYGKEGDVLIGISTSGQAKNIEYACIMAQAKGMKVIGFTGRDGGRLKDLANASIVVPEMETYKIQELHLPIYHALCLMLEERFF